MIDNITNKNIDNCPDVLIGKILDPKSQVEQITLALIYMFMPDIDKEAIEKFKGKVKFISGEYAKYRWRKLFDPSLSIQNMLAFYRIYLIAATSKWLAQAKPHTRAALLNQQANIIYLVFAVLMVTVFAVTAMLHHYNYL